MHVVWDWHRSPFFLEDLRGGSSTLKNVSIVGMSLEKWITFAMLWGKGFWVAENSLTHTEDIVVCWTALSQLKMSACSTGRTFFFILLCCQMSGWRWAPLTGGWRVGAESETARVRGDITRSHELRHFVVKMSADGDLYNNANIIFLPRSVRLFYNIPSAFFSFCVIKRQWTPKKNI